MTDVVTLGETMGVVRTTDIGRLRVGHPMSLSIAGAESNVAVGLARLGHSVAWVGRVGRDPVGELVLRELRAEGVDTSWARIDDGAATGLMIKVHRTAVLSQVNYARTASAGSRVCGEDIPTGVISAARLLHLTGITPALSDSAWEAVQIAVEAARAAGVPISLDLNYRAALWSRADAANGLRELVRASQIVFASEHETGLVTDASDPLTAAREIAEMGPSVVVIKRGDAGYAAVIAGQSFVGAAKRAPVVDPVGAGDAFVAAHLAGFLEDRSPEETLERANLVGAIVVSTPGDWEGFPTQRELYAFASPEDPVVR